MSRDLIRLTERLSNLPVAETLDTALAEQATRLADEVRAVLSTPPGGPHDHPWRQSGALQASIETHADGLSATVSTADPAAAPQELGTINDPPRPFLAPTATAHGESIANEIGRKLADLLRAL